MDCFDPMRLYSPLPDTWANLEDRVADDAMMPAYDGRSLVDDYSGLVDAVIDPSGVANVSNSYSAMPGDYEISHRPAYDSSYANDPIEEPLSVPANPSNYDPPFPTMPDKPPVRQKPVRYRDGFREFEAYDRASRERAAANPDRIDIPALLKPTNEETNVDGFMTLDQFDEKVLPQLGEYLGSDANEPDIVDQQFAAFNAQFDGMMEPPGMFGPNGGI